MSNDISSTDVGFLPSNVGALAIIKNIIEDEEGKSAVAKKIMAPFNVDTPKEKVKKRPDGFDYVEGSYMDHQAKEHMPLYKYTLLHQSIEFGWVLVVVSLEDRITGNIELGSGAARIQVRKGTEAPNFRDIIDLGNNMKAALTQSIKNAQSRFGISADIYRKREGLATKQEKERFAQMKKEINKISLNKGSLFSEQWSNLGTGFDTFLDRWEPYIGMNEQKNDHSSSASEIDKKII